LYSPQGRDPDSPRFRCESSEVALWIVDLNQISDAPAAQLGHLLNPEELQRNSRFRQKPHRRRDLIGRGLLRQLLSAYLNIPTDELDLRRSENGKPYLHSPPSDLHFNYSHSHNYLAYAFVQGPEIGVDIEYNRRSNDLVGIADNYFSPGEIHSLKGLTKIEYRERFFAYWTLKEAYIKARGEGIYLGLDNFSLVLDESTPDSARIEFVNSEFDTPSGWQFLRYTTRPLYPTAIALRDVDQRYRLTTYGTDDIASLLAPQP
jgi:4'-phosphopantetheinyl transferase